VTELVQFIINVRKFHRLHTDSHASDSSAAGREGRTILGAQAKPLYRQMALSTTTQRIMAILTPTERETLHVCLHISQMLNVCNFGNMAGIYAIVHLVPHACQHITVDGHTCYYCLLQTNQGNYVRELFLKKTWEVSLSIGVRITMIRCVVYLLGIF
jgi:hypothetical protein